MTLTEILTQQAQFTNGSGFRVEIDRPYSWVSILKINSMESTVFLQGEEGTEFINEVERLWHETGDLPRNTIAEALAGPYLEGIE